MSPYIAVGIPTNDLINYQTRNVQVPHMDIIKGVAQFYGVNWLHLIGPIRKREFSEPRQIAIYLIRTKSKKTLAEIGDIFSRDHSSICYATDTVSDLIDTNSAYRLKFEQIKQQLFS